MDLVCTFKSNDLVGKLFHDEDPPNPRTEYDHVATMVCLHKRYDLGDKHEYHALDFHGWDDLRDRIVGDHQPVAILPVYMYDHSGVTVSTTPFSCPWDSGQVGWIFIPRAKALKEWCQKRVTRAFLRRMEAALISEVNEYDTYLKGDVYGYVIEDSHGHRVDSCWGLFGFDYARGECMDYMHRSTHVHVEEGGSV